MNRIFTIFFSITIIGTLLFFYLLYKDYQFKNNPLSPKTLEKLERKNQQLRNIIRHKYTIDFHIPVIISDTLPNNLYGLASYKNGDIKIQLNKKRFQENENYMIENVLPHEYAHALMFHFGFFERTNGGHTKQWQQFCIDIGGQKCDRFVNFDDILIEKLGGIY